MLQYKKFVVPFYLPFTFTFILFFLSFPAVSFPHYDKNALSQSILQCRTKACILSHGLVPVRGYFLEGCDRLYRVDNKEYFCFQNLKDESAIYYFLQNNGSIKVHWCDKGRMKNVLIEEGPQCEYIKNILLSQKVIEKSCNQSLFNKIAALSGFPIYRKPHYIEYYELARQQRAGVDYTMRQVGHGLLCIATAGLWEGAYYPIEEHFSPFFGVEATYAYRNSNKIERLQIHTNAAGGVAYERIY